MGTFDWTKPKPLLPLDKYIVGHARTYSSELIITDSAAGATAYACGSKTYNQAIGVHPDGSACASFVEAAKMSGLRVGVVTNTRVTHATPASFISHCGDRNLEYNIANQEARNVTYDLLFGGGKQYFDSRRPDGQDLIAHMQSKGFNFYQTNAEMQSARLPALGLFADSHLDYEIDRKLNASSTQPSHSAMVKKALELLSATTENFVLIIESGKIDLSSHNNDAAAHYWEVHEYQNTIKVIEDFLVGRRDTAVIATSDHSTGGISTGANLRNMSYPPYTWHPSVILRVNASVENMANQIIAGADLETVYRTATGLDLANDYPSQYSLLLETPPSTGNPYTNYLSDAVNAKALIGWTSMGHTGVDVNVYQFGNRIHQITGVLDNTFIGQIVVKEFDLEKQMQDLAEKYSGWYPDLISESDRVLLQQEYMEHHHLQYLTHD